MRSSAGRSEVATTTTERRMPFRAQVVIEKGADFPVALANQRNHADVGLTVAAHGAKQGALSHSASAEQPDALSLSAGQQAVDGANAGHERLDDMLAIERTRGDGEQVVERRRLDGAAAIHRLSESIEHAAEQARAGFDQRRDRAGHNLVAELQPAGFLERHRQHAAAAEADHLHAHRAALRRLNLAKIAQSRGRPDRFDEQSHHFGHAPERHTGIDRVEQAESSG